MSYYDNDDNQNMWPFYVGMAIYLGWILFMALRAFKIL